MSAATKTCKGCGETKDASAFSKRKAAKDGLQTWCKTCLYAAERNWMERHPDKVRQQRTRSASRLRNRYATDEGFRQARKARARAYRQTLTATELQRRNRIQWLKRNYDLTPEEFQELQELQRGKCAICEREVQLVVDHDHETGSVRGLLCKSCNRAVGVLGDTVSGVKRAVRYLEGKP